MVQDRAILTIATRNDLSNGAIFNDLERPLPAKVMPLFNAEYLTNATRYRHSFNGILIGTYTVTHDLLLKGVILKTLSDLANYSPTQSAARSLCDS